MATNVIAQVVGGQKRVIDSAANVGEIREQLGLTGNYKAQVNGDNAEDSAILRTGDFVSFSEAVKGA